MRIGCEMRTEGEGILALDEVLCRRGDAQGFGLCAWPKPHRTGVTTRLCHRVGAESDANRTSSTLGWVPVSVQPEASRIRTGGEPNG